MKRGLQIPGLYNCVNGLVGHFIPKPARHRPPGKKRGRIALHCPVHHDSGAGELFDRLFDDDPPARSIIGPQQKAAPALLDYACHSRFKATRDASSTAPRRPLMAPTIGPPPLKGCGLGQSLTPATPARSLMNAFARWP